MRRIRLLALDVDGTLLDRAGVLRPTTVAAVRRAAAAGIQPVLCTGRRFRRSLPISKQLGLNVPIVCNSGALVKDPESRRTLWRADLDRFTLRQVLAVFGDHDEPAVTFLDHDHPADHPEQSVDFLVTVPATGRPLFDDYLDRNREHVGVDPKWESRTDLAHHHLCAIGDRPAMLALERAIHDRLTDALVQTFVQKSPRYAGTMCEVLRHDANKWTALLHLAGGWGVEPSEICAMGDDQNDVPMLRGAGVGVAMGHAAPAIQAAADHVTGSDDEDGVAAWIEVLLREQAN